MGGMCHLFEREVIPQKDVWEDATHESLPWRPRHQTLHQLFVPTWLECDLHSNLTPCQLQRQNQKIRIKHLQVEMERPQQNSNLLQSWHNVGVWIQMSHQSFQKLRRVLIWMKPTNTWLSPLNSNVSASSVSESYTWVKFANFNIHLPRTETGSRKAIWI